MIRREWEDDWALFSQPEHARVSGVVAEAWGSRNFARPKPWDDVLRATYEHDVGWTEWEKAPALNADRLPANFTETPVELNFDIFRKGVQNVYSRGYPNSAALGQPTRGQHLPRDPAERGLAFVVRGRGQD